MPDATKQKPDQLNVRLSAPLIRLLKQQALERGVPLKRLVAEALAEKFQHKAAHTQPAPKPAKTREKSVDEQYREYLKNQEAV